MFNRTVEYTLKKLNPIIRNKKLILKHYKISPLTVIALKQTAKNSFPAILISTSIIMKQNINFYSNYKTTLCIHNNFAALVREHTAEYN